MKRPRKITKVIEGRRITLFAGRWYVAGEPFYPFHYKGPRTISIYRRHAKPGEPAVAQVHNLTRDGANKFLNAFNTSGKFGFQGRKWPTREKRKEKPKWCPWHSPMLVWPGWDH